MEDAVRLVQTLLSQLVFFSLHLRSTTRGAYSVWHGSWIVGLPPLISVYGVVKSPEADGPFQYACRFEYSAAEYM